MDQLFRLKNTFVEFLSPKRRRTIGPATPVRTSGIDKTSYAPASEPRDGKAKAAVAGKVNQKYLSPSDTRFRGTRKRPREDDEYEDEEDYEVSPDESVSQVAQAQANSQDSVATPAASDEADEADEQTAITLPDDEEEEEEDVISPADKVQEYLDRQAELALRREAVQVAKAQGGWHPDEIYLFERLSMRSFEELLPASWQMDFRTLPVNLFTTVPANTIINFNCSSSSRGVKALQSLLTLGNRVEDKIGAGRPCEKLMSKEIESYIKWSHMDAGVDKKHFIPVLTVVSARHKEAVSSISDSITTEMECLAKKHREELTLEDPQMDEDGEVELYSRQPPLLYGIIVAQTMAIIVTLDSSNPEAKLRHLTHFDFKETSMSVWNGMAIAIIVIVARNYLMSLKDELEAYDEDSSDPDA